jgi:hypothetical protein
LQQAWATPVPEVQDLDALNAHLHACCLHDRQRKQAGQEESIGERFERERAQAWPLPARRFDPCLARPACVDKYQTVRFDRNRYRVPRVYAFQNVTIKAYVGHVDIVAGDQVIAHPRRSYGHDEQVLDPVHYLVTLARKPAALDHANVYRDWQLPPVFGELRYALEQQHGPRTGARHYIRVLQLLAEYPVERVHEAIVRSRRGDCYDAAAIVRRAHHLGAMSDIPMSLEQTLDRPRAQRPEPNCFRRVGPERARAHRSNSTTQPPRSKLPTFKTEAPAGTKRRPGSKRSPPCGA